MELVQSLILSPISPSPWGSFEAPQPAARPFKHVPLASPADRRPDGVVSWNSSSFPRDVLLSSSNLFGEVDGVLASPHQLAHRMMLQDDEEAPLFYTLAPPSTPHPQHPPCRHSVRRASTAEREFLAASPTLGPHGGGFEVENPLARSTSSSSFPSLHTGTPLNSAGSEDDAAYSLASSSMCASSTAPVFVRQLATAPFRRDSLPILPVPRGPAAPPRSPPMIRFPRGPALQPLVLPTSPGSAVAPGPLANPSSPASVPTSARLAPVTPVPPLTAPLASPRPPALPHAGSWCSSPSRHPSDSGDDSSIIPSGLPRSPLAAARLPSNRGQSSDSPTLSLPLPSAAGQGAHLKR